MRLVRMVSAWVMAAAMSAQQFPQTPVFGVRAEKVRWQAPGEGSAPPPAPVQAVKKRGGKTKWIVIAAVAGGAAVGLVAVNKRLGNEGKGIF